MSNILNPKTTTYEFLGPPGTFLMVTVLPILVYVIYLGCTSDGCPSPEYISRITTPSYLRAIFTFKNVIALFDLEAFVMYIGYLIWLVILWVILPGKWLEGTQLRTGNKLFYKENGFKSFLVTIGMMCLALMIKGPEAVLFVFEKFIGFVTASIIVSFAVATWVYVRSFHEGALLALGGNSGYWIYDYVMGRELNPRIGSFDVKYFVELRPGIICWTLVNIAMAAKQYHDLGDITVSMFFVVLFQFWYCIDSVYNEPAVLTTIDITMDGFGWMLSFGLFTWLGFLYALQARYLALHPVHLSWLEIVIIVALKSIGYAIFRGANNEKNTFRVNPEDPKVRHLKYITTEAGSRLLISGWWGRARHINYFGDWLMAWAWCLPCGSDNIFPYFYLVYFTVLLVHRELRDEEKCRKKYKKDWDRYCEIVPWRIIPGIY